MFKQHVGAFREDRPARNTLCAHLKRHDQKNVGASIAKPHPEETTKKGESNENNRNKK
ncbi:MAG: hypothetical protein FWC68_00560 [Oscillospiraceae bacterium]|nr:hypothetical protein [Oscillospiraceae bacterium]